MNPEQIKLAITLDDGSLKIMSFLTKGRGASLPEFAEWTEVDGWWKRDPSDLAILDELARTFPPQDLDGTPRPQPIGFRRISDSELPADRTYREAWKDSGETIVHDMPRARVIHLSRVRVARAAKLDQLDRDWMRATGRGDKAGVLEAEDRRQLLRDLPASLDVESAQTVEDLKQRWPALLG